MGGNGVGDNLLTAMAESQYVTAKTSIWWDIENCQVPKICDAHAIAQNISSALTKVNYRGPVSIIAYGDSTRIPLPLQHALSSTGIFFNHVPAGVKDASDKKILVDMLFWAVDNPAPANFLLISGDRDFSNALHQLRMRRYNILIAQPYKASVPLVAAAKSVWIWKSLVVGGPPLSGVELQQLLHNSSNFSNSDSTPRQSASQSSFLANQKLGKDTTDNQNSSKQPQKKQTKRNSSSVSNGTQCKRNSSQPPNASGSSSNVSNGTQCKRNTSQPPNASGSSSSVSHGTQGDSNTNGSYHARDLMLEKHLIDMHSADNFRNSSSSAAPNNHHPFISVPNIGNLSISQPPHFTHSSPNLKQRAEGWPKQNPLSTSPFISAGPQNIPSNSCDPSLVSSSPFDVNNNVPGDKSPEVAQGDIDVVLLALDTLRSEKMKPHVENITECVRYGVLGHKNTDVKKALEIAVKVKIVSKHTPGNEELYAKKKEKMWKCVNSSSGDPNQYDDVVWYKTQEFVASACGRSALMASRSRYEAGVMLKNTCLEGLALGNVLQILNMVIKHKNWIVPHQSGWQPITILVSKAPAD